MDHFILRLAQRQWRFGGGGERVFIWSWLVARFSQLAAPKASLTIDEMVEGEPELWHLVKGMRESPFFCALPEGELVNHIQVVAGASLDQPLCGKDLRDQLAQVYRDPCGGGINTLKVRNDIFDRVQDSN